jgi:release factor glutamine methyltransferase
VVRQIKQNAIAANLIRDAAMRFSAAGIESARLDTEVLLRHALGLDRTRLFMRLREPVDEEATARFRALVDRRLAGEPVAYLTGEREFMGLPFAVGPGVLVPRPETELLVEWAAGWLAGKIQATTIDVGTGSGAIVLALAATLADAHGGLLIGCDRSAGALEYANRNRANLNLESRVLLVRGDLLTWLGAPVDLILANLPYLTPEQFSSNSDLGAEPRLALVSGEDGLGAIRRLLADAGRVLAPGGALALELDPSQAQTITGLAAAALPDARVSVNKDLAGRDRFVIAERT